MSSKVSPDKQLPISIDDWKRLAKEWNATGGVEELGSPVKISSASRFEYVNFRGFQALYDFPKEGSTLAAAITSQFPSISDYDLEDIPGYNAYLAEIEKAAVHGMSQDSIAQTRVSRSLNVFANAWHFQRHVLVGDEHAVDVPKVSWVSPVLPVAEGMSLAKQTANLSLDDDFGFVSDGAPEMDTIGDELEGDADDSSDNDDDDDHEDPGMHFPQAVLKFSG